MKLGSKDTAIGRLDWIGQQIENGKPAISAQKGSAWDSRHKTKGGKSRPSKRRQRKDEELYGGWY